MGFCDSLGNNTVEGAILPAGRGALFLTAEELSALSQSTPLCLCQSSRPRGPHAESGPLVGVLPRRVFKAMLAQCRLCGWPLVPPWIFRDRLQVTILPSGFDFWATCSKTTELCNLSWRILCLWRSLVHSASFPKGLLYSWYWQGGSEIQQNVWAHVVREQQQGLQPGWSGPVQALWSRCLRTLPASLNLSLFSSFTTLAHVTLTI